MVVDLKNKKMKMLVVIGVGLIALVLGCSKPVSPTLSPTSSATMSLVKESPTMPSSRSTPSIEPHCKTEVVFSKEKVEWAQWGANDHELVYKLFGDPNYWSYSIETNAEIQQHEIHQNKMEEAIEDLLENPDIIIAKISPDKNKILFSETKTQGYTRDSYQKKIYSDIYLVNGDHKQLVVGDLVGAVSDFEWTTDGQKAAVIMSTYSVSSIERGSIYLLDIIHGSMKVLLSFHEGGSDYAFKGFSEDNQWAFISYGKITEKVNINDGSRVSFLLPDNTQNWWGIHQDLVLIQTFAEPVNSDYTDVSFFWGDLKTKGVVSTSITNLLVNDSRSGIIMPSPLFNYLAIIDKDDLMAVFTLCKPYE